jgi:hypothetical protein
MRNLLVLAIVLAGCSSADTLASPAATSTLAPSTVGASPTGPVAERPTPTQGVAAITIAPAPTSTVTAAPSASTPGPTLAPTPTTAPVMTTTPPQHLDAVIADYGYSTFKAKQATDVSLSWAVVVRNPNHHAYANGVVVSVTLYDKNGGIIDTGSSRVDFMIPGQSGAVAASISDFSNPNLRNVARMQVEISTDRFEDFNGTPSIFEVGRIRNSRDNFGHIVTTASVTADFDRHVDDTRGVAVYYNGDRIVGGADHFLDTIPSRKKTTIQIDGPPIGKVTRTEIYISLSNLTVS